MLEKEQKTHLSVLVINFHAEIIWNIAVFWKTLHVSRVVQKRGLTLKRYFTEQSRVKIKIFKEYSHYIQCKPLCSRNFTMIQYKISLLYIVYVCVMLLITSTMYTRALFQNIVSRSKYTIMNLESRRFVFSAATHHYIGDCIFNTIKYTTPTSLYQTHRTIECTFRCITLQQNHCKQRFMLKRNII